MVFIENDEVPVRGVDPLVIGLDASGLLVHAEEILEGTETHDGPRFIGFLVLLIIRQATGNCRTSDELPALKIHVGEKVLAPSGLYCRFEGKDQAEELGLPF